MYIYGKIIDDDDQSPIAGASVTLVDSSGKYRGSGVAAGNDGRFGFNVFPSEGDQVLISDVSHEAMLFDPLDLSGEQLPLIRLSKDQQSLPEVVVTKKKMSSWMWLLLAGAAVLFAAKGSKKRV